MRDLVTTDIHGGYLGLIQALERANYDPSSDRITYLGDIQDGWSQAPQLLDFFRNTEHKIMLLGNHDECFLDWVSSGCMMLRHPLYNHGGKVTEEVYFALGLDRAREDAEFLKQSKLYHIDEQNRLFVHAGWDINYDAKSQFLETLTWDRNFWEDVYYDRIQVNSFKEVYIGHTPTIRYSGLAQPLNKQNVWNMDTAAAFSGVVTVMDIDTKQYWQSDKLLDLYPLERGRNR